MAACLPACLAGGLSAGDGARRRGLPLAARGAFSPPLSNSVPKSSCSTNPSSPPEKRRLFSLHCRFKPGEGSFHGAASSRRPIGWAEPSRVLLRSGTDEWASRGVRVLEVADRARWLLFFNASLYVCVSVSVRVVELLSRCSADAALTLQWAAQCTTPPSV